MQKVFTDKEMKEIMIKLLERRKDKRYRAGAMQAFSFCGVYPNEEYGKLKEKYL